jgi:topoisomerase IA-like protein
MIQAITKNGLQRLAAPPKLNLEKYKSDRKITDEEILKILEQPTAKASSSKSKSKKKKKTAKKESSDESSSDE